MGIIGVVAALTIPNVNKNTGEAEKVARFKKLYAELSEAHDRATAVYGPVEKWFVNDNAYEKRAERYLNRITEFMKVTKTCDSNESSEVECMTKGVKTFLYGGTTTGGIYKCFDYKSAILANGASFGINIYPIGCGYYMYDSTNKKKIYCGLINLDIDGPQRGKNTYGIDLFSLAITTEGIKPAAGPDPSTGYNAPAGFSTTYLANNMQLITYYGFAAGQWIMDNGNMDYLNTKDRTDKTLSRTCKNGKILGYNTAEGEAHSCK